jgi:ATP-dependent protease ClpP protease subunit
MAKKIKKVSPDLLIYGMIDDDMTTQVCNSILYIAQLKKDVINIGVNCVGGNTDHGTAIYNTIKNCGVPVDMYIDGVAASMGAILTTAARNTYMSKYSRMMLHEGKVMSGGTADEMRANADAADGVNAKMVAMVMQKNGMSEDDVRSKYFNGKDNWLNAQEAVAAKLCDGIYDLDEVNISASNEIEVFAVLNDATQKGLINKINQTSMEAKYDSAVIVALGLNDNADNATVVAALKSVIAKAAKVTQAETAQKKAQDDLEEYKKGAVTKEITAMLDGATKANKITAKQKGIFAKQYAEDADGLKELLDTMGFTSITSKINESDKDAEHFGPEVTALMAQGWDKLDRSDRLGELKALSEKAFNALYKAKMGYLPNEKPVPFFPGQKKK